MNTPAKARAKVLRKKTAPSAILVAWCADCGNAIAVTVTKTESEFAPACPHCPSMQNTHGVLLRCIPLDSQPYVVVRGKDA